MKSIDVTELVDFGNPDDECLPITKCICGQDYSMWSETLSIYKEDPWQCSQCGRKYYFGNRVKVYMVEE